MAAIDKNISARHSRSLEFEETSMKKGGFGTTSRNTPSNATNAVVHRKKNLGLSIDNSLDYVSPLTDHASDSGTDLSSDKKKASSDNSRVGKGEKLSFKTPLANSTTSSSSSYGKRERAVSPSLSRRSPRVDSLASDEASVARLLAEMSGYTIDLSSPKASIQVKKASKKSQDVSSGDDSSESGSLISIPLSRTNSSVSIGNVLVSLGRSRSNSAEVFSGGFMMERSELRPRSDSVGQLGLYTLAQRKAKIEKYIEKRKHRVWTKKIKYDVRKNFADSRVRVKGRFVRKDDEANKRKIMEENDPEEDEDNGN